MSKQSFRLAFLFAATYFASYLTRINFAAVIAEMITDMQVSKTAFSLALTGCSVTYGAGQIISGLCGDRIRPKRLVLFGLLLACFMNLLIPFCTHPAQMTVIWCINGFAQAFMWPPMTAILAQSIPEEDYSRATVLISQGSSAGSIAVYLIAPLLITLWGWKSVFITSALIALAICPIWVLRCPNVPPARKVQDAAPAQGSSVRLFTPFFLMLMAGIVLQGMLRDGVTTWMPSFIAGTYSLSNAISILTGVALPVFSMLSFSLSNTVYRKWFSNPAQCAAAIFGFGAACALILYLTSGKSAISSVVFSALLTGAMHGINLMLIGLIPPYFKNFGKVSTVSGILNSCTYIGSAISTYGVAAFSEYAGWHPTLLVWFAIALSGTILCYICGYPARKKSGIF